jgi:hypothetical protein
MHELTDRAGADTWSRLLTAVREALAGLKAEDLEALAARAERMLEAAYECGMLVPQPELGALKTEYRLLRDLLLATDRNIQVLRRACERKRSDADAGEVRRPWVR